MPPSPQTDGDVEMDADDWDLTTASGSSGTNLCPNPFHSIFGGLRADRVSDPLSELTQQGPQPPLTDPPEDGPPESVTEMKASPTIPPPYSGER